MILRQASCLLAALLATSASAFVYRLLPKHARATVIAAPLQSYDPYRHSDGERDSLARSKARTDIRNLLTQRSIQSFVYLLNEVRDIHTTAWIEKTLEFKKLDSYHGTGALNMTLFPSWDSFFLQMVTMKAETVVVEARQKKRQHRGWSNKANYLEHLNQSKPPESKPATQQAQPTRRTRGFNNAGYLNNLASNEITSNKNETNNSTEIQSKTNNSTVINSSVQADSAVNIEPKKKSSGWASGAGSYLENLSNGNAALPEEEKQMGERARVNPFLEKEKKPSEYEFEIDPASLVYRIMSVREQISKEWTNDLETLYVSNDEILTSYLDRQMEARKEEEEKDDDNDNESAPSSDSAFLDRSSMVMLTNSLSSQDRDSSPFRRSNFDLLVLLSTQESIHRVLREYSEAQEQENFDWLKAFYAKRVGSFFDGHGQTYGRADDFLQELIVSPPIAQQTRNDGIHFIDPMKMVEDIIRERSEVAREWKEVVATIPSDHVDLRRLLLTRRMTEVEDDVDDVPTFSAIPKSKKKSKEGIFEAGAFELSVFRLPK